MNHKILIILCLVFWGYSATGQSHYQNPIAGYTHTYEAYVTDPGNMNPVRWYVATDVYGLNKAQHGADYTFQSPGFSTADKVLLGTGVYSVTIEWGSSLEAGSVFYVFIEVDNYLTGCTNRMALPVTVAQSMFNVLVHNVTASANPGTVNPSDPDSDIETETCPDGIVDAVWDGIGHTNIGYSQLIFRVERDISVLGWQFEYQITETNQTPFTIHNIQIVNPGGNLIYSGTDANKVQGVGITSDYVLVYIEIENQQGTMLDINFNIVTQNNQTKDTGNSLDANIEDNTARHTLLPMPAISGFGSR